MSTSTLTRTTLKLKVDYGRTIEDLVKAGKYDYANRDVNSQNFPSSKSGQAQLEAILFPIDHWMESEEILALLDQEGLRAGNSLELAFVGLQHPDEQRKGPIVALGSVWRAPDGYCRVAYLWGDGSYRRLGLNWLDGGWDSRYRFLAFRK